MDIFFYAGLAATGFGAGLLGALLGLGGGVFVVPALVLIFGLPPLTAIGTSNVAVVATSTAGASTYVRSRLTNIRLALILLISTTIAALISSLVASWLPVQLLSGLFAIVLFYTAVTMLRSNKPQSAPTLEGYAKESIGEKLGLESSYYDPASGTTVEYTPRKIRTGMGISALAGVVAGLLGIGGGIVQTPVMNLLMRVPLKVSAGTSNFMIGITATSAAVVRFAHGDINPLIAVPTTLFVFFGARLGAWLVPRTKSSQLKVIFGWVAIVIAILMLLQAVGIYTPPKR
ncbi:MAG: sulfite exporter TauE/SafE family protein [Chloroflexota bacterium]